MRAIPALASAVLCLASVLAVLTVLLPAPAREQELESDAVDQREPLAGKLLVAAPGLPDAYFAGTVIYLLVDDDNGALGVVLNRGRDHAEPQAVPFWDGGPVGRDRVFVLHDDLTGMHTRGGSVVVGDVAVATEPSFIDQVLRGEGPLRARVFAGYAGWGPEQLSREIAHGAWLSADADPRLVLAHDEALAAQVRARAVRAR